MRNYFFIMVFPSGEKKHQDKKTSDICTKGVYRGIDPFSNVHKPFWRPPYRKLSQLEVNDSIGHWPQVESVTQASEFIFCLKSGVNLKIQLCKLVTSVKTCSPCPDRVGVPSRVTPAKSAHNVRFAMLLMSLHSIQRRQKLRTQSLDIDDFRIRWYFMNSETVFFWLP